MDEPQLTVNALYKGRLAALENAYHLATDASVLMERQRFSSSFFLANIATEELGKYALTVSTAVDAAKASVDWKRFWKNFRSHKGKTQSLLALEDLHNVLIGTSSSLFNGQENKKYALLQEEVKMRALYADFHGARFSTPNQVITHEVCGLANELLAQRLEMVISFEEKIASKLTASQLRMLTVEHYLKP